MKAFDDKTAWVTGASSGIGKAVATELSREGARIVLSGRNEDALHEVASSCAGPTLVLPFDTTDFDALPRMEEKVADWCGPLDLLFNNAGISQRSLAIDTDFDVYRNIMDVDFFAPVRLTQLVLPKMVARRSGHIAVTSSVAGKIGVPLRTGYCAAKHAVIGFFDSLRSEVEDAYGIAVSTIVPGSVRTAIAVNALSGSGATRGVSDQNIENGLPAEKAAQIIVRGLADREREILVAEGFEAQAVQLRASDPERLFALTAAQGRTIAEARDSADGEWLPEPASTR